MDMAVEGEEWLVGFDESLDGDAADMDVEGRVIDGFSVEVCAVEGCLIGW